MDIDGWESMYRSGERGKEEEPTRLLVETAAQLKPGTVIDLACGTGRNALFLAERGWTVTAIDGSETAIQILRSRAGNKALTIKSEVADLAARCFAIPGEAFDLVVIAFYMQHDLFAKAKIAVRPGGSILAIAHTTEVGEKPSSQRLKPGELRTFFAGWQIVHEYEGPSRDPAHHRPVAEIVAIAPASGKAVRTTAVNEQT